LRVIRSKLSPEDNALRGEDQRESSWGGGTNAEPQVIGTHSVVPKGTITDHGGGGGTEPSFWFEDKAGAGVKRMGTVQ